MSPLPAAVTPAALPALVALAATYGSTFLSPVGLPSPRGNPLFLVGAIAVIEASTSGALSLLGFGITALIDAAASVALILRFLLEAGSPRSAELAERRAERTIGIALLALATYASQAQTKLSIGLGTAPTLIYGVHYLALTKGFFKEEGFPEVKVLVFQLKMFTLLLHLMLNFLLKNKHLLNNKKHLVLPQIC